MRRLGTLALAVLAGGQAWAQEGRDLYTGGTALTGQVAGIAGRGLACAGCHGQDAAGGGEGRSRIPAIDRTALEARSGGAYDLARFGRALTLGIAPDGRTLGRAMPRFSATPAQVEALWRFLGGVRAEAEAGITGTSITFAIPTRPENRADAEAFRDAMTAAWAARDVARVYGRGVRFETQRLEADPSGPLMGLAGIVPAPDASGPRDDRLARTGLPLLIAGLGEAGRRDPDVLPSVLPSGPCRAADPGALAALIDDALTLCGRGLTRAAFRAAVETVCTRRARQIPEEVGIEAGIAPRRAGEQ